MNNEIKREINSFNYRSLLHNVIGNGIYLTDMQKSILNQYEIPYSSCMNVKELIYNIENILDETDNEELELILDELAEFHYYHDTKK